ncbi:MAG: GIY-YIG nuclease family protein [Candidatus Thorarchaeota archaeon]|nr:GIY-YIG nuclease family protein [Candidatus Thorarchaeota archaeon]
MRGVYILIIDLKQTLSFQLKSLGNLSFEKGTWIYVGSAMGIGSTSLENRIRRHFRSEKTIHWHIDHLLNSDSKIRCSIWSESSGPVECDIAKSIEQLDNVYPGPKGFGASDCKKKCFTHLFYSKIESNLEKKIHSIFAKQKLKPKVTQDGYL